MLQVCDLQTIFSHNSDRGVCHRFSSVRALNPVYRRIPIASGQDRRRGTHCSVLQWVEWLLGLRMKRGQAPQGACPPFFMRART
jgi:hypothetical protein